MNKQKISGRTCEAKVTLLHCELTSILIKIKPRKYDSSSWHHWIFHHNEPYNARVALYRRKRTPEELLRFLGADVHHMPRDHCLLLVGSWQWCCGKEGGHSALDTMLHSNYEQSLHKSSYFDSVGHGNSFCRWGMSLFKLYVFEWWKYKLFSTDCVLILHTKDINTLRRCQVGRYKLE